MPRTMHAAVLEQYGAPLVIDTVELADPGPGQVVVKIAHCGLCHSDVSVMTGEAPVQVPTILGHEACGTVEEVGPGVTTLAVGDRVMLTPVPACGRCYYCVRGEHSLCDLATGIVTQTLPDGSTPASRNGEVVWQGLGLAGFGEYTVVPEDAAIRIDADLPLDVVTVIGCAVQTGVGAALNTARVGPGDTVLVMGQGGIGVSIVQGARIAGASRIIVSDPIGDRRDAAERFGATDVIDPTAEDVASACLKLTGGIGVDHAFDAVGRAALVHAGFDAVRKGGQVVLVGAGPIEESVELNRIMWMMSGKRVLGCLLGSSNSRRDVPRLLDLYRAGRLDLDSMVTARRPLAEINEAVDDMVAGRGLRTVLTP